MNEKERLKMILRTSNFLKINLRGIMFFSIEKIVKEDDSKKVIKLCDELNIDHLGLINERLNELFEEVR